MLSRSISALEFFFFLSLVSTVLSWTSIDNHPAIFKPKLSKNMIDISNGPTKLVSESQKKADCYRTGGYRTYNGGGGGLPYIIISGGGAGFPVTGGGAGGIVIPGAGGAAGASVPGAGASAGASGAAGASIPRAGAAGGATASGGTGAGTASASIQTV